MTKFCVVLSSQPAGPWVTIAASYYDTESSGVLRFYKYTDWGSVINGAAFGRNAWVSVEEETP